MSDLQSQSLKTIRSQFCDFVRHIERTNPHLVSDDYYHFKFICQTGSVFIALRDLDDLCGELGITVQE